jgi:pimeloyl-ACP methyl ester carboxylesterase
MADFVLVHGAWHGGWCWNELVPELERLGHRAHTLDLPGGGADTTPTEGVTLSACAERVAEAVRRVGGPVWLVGHSMGGGPITQAAELVAERLDGLVYVSAALPRAGETLMEVLYGGGAGPVADQIVIDEAAGTSALREGALEACFYNTCSPAQIARAKTLLKPTQAVGLSLEPVRLTPERGERVPRYYVECLQDRCVTPEIQRRMYEAAGVRAVATLDTDHSPFWSDPQGLARALDGFAAS